MAPAALAMAVYNLSRRSAILEADVAAHAAAFGYFSLFGTHGQPPSPTRVYAVYRGRALGSTWAPQSSCGEKQATISLHRALANAAASRQRVRVLLTGCSRHLANRPEPPWNA